MNNKEENYTPIHLHTTYGSIGDSIIKIDELIKRAKELNISSLAVTNHGSMTDIYDFYFECKKENIKPLLGCEIYTVEDVTVKDKKNKRCNHLILIAINNTGLKNLLSILAISELEFKYYKPRIDLSNLEKMNTEGLVCTTACVGSHINQLIIQDRILEAKEEVIRLNNIFEYFFLEIQPGDFDEVIKTNKQLIEFHKELNIPLIASNDIHYLYKEDYIAHDAHVKSYRKKPLDGDLCYPDKCYYLMSRQELFDSLNKHIDDKELINEAINNTNIVANLGEIIVTADKLDLPDYECPEHLNPTKYLEYICLERLDKIKDKINNVSEYIDKLYEELEVIDKLGFSSYYLIVKDFMDYANKNNIPTGPGRGSVCGSLTAYLGRLTKIDPIKYDLLFERFLSVHRTGSIPDIDSDFGSVKRGDVFDYVVNKYGVDHCATVATFNIRKAKSAIKDAGRLLNLKEVSEEISSLIPMVYYDDNDEKLTDLSITDSLKFVKELQEYYEIYPELFNIAIKLEGLPRSASQHAAGTLIAKSSLHDLIPMTKKKDSDMNATTLDLLQAEKIKLVKYDFLGLSTLDVLDTTKKITQDYFDVEFDKYDDKNVWDLISSKYTTSLFQIASKTYKQRMWRLAPKTIEELAACLALVRGPCISAKADEVYMDVLDGKREIELIHPFYDDAVKDTCGIMIYQEQLMACCNNFGLPLHECYNIMKAAAKKDFEKIQAYEKKLWDLAINYMDKDTFDKIYKIIVDSGLYLFNKSHAVAYATLCYETAYYKYYYPEIYLAAELTNIYNNCTSEKRREKVAETADECRRLGIKFLPVDIKKSKWDFTVEDKSIRIGMCAISSFGYKAYKELQRVLDMNTQITCFEDIYEEADKSKITKTPFNALIFSGAFGDITSNYETHCRLREEDPADEVFINTSLRINIYENDSDIELMMLSYNYIYNVLNTLPMNNYNKIKKRDTITIEGIVKSLKVKNDKHKKKMGWANIVTGSGSIEVIVFSNIFSDYRKFLKPNSYVKITIKKEDEYRAFLVSAEPSTNILNVA